jgi:cyclase
VNRLIANRQILLRKGVVAFTTLALVATSWMAVFDTPITAARQQPAAATAALEILQLRPNVHVIAGAGGHIVVQHGEEGAIVVDTGAREHANAVLAAIRRITAAPIRYIINTTGDADHVGGNEAIAAAGEWFGARAGGLGGIVGASGVPIIATEELAVRMATPSQGQPPWPTAAQPSETFSGRMKPLRLNGDAIEIVPYPAAHTDGNLIVFFRGSDVIVAGDLIDMTRFPAIDSSRGGSVQGLLRALNDLKDRAIPQLPLAWKDGGTVVVPGHGRMLEKDDVVQYRDMVTIVRDVVKSLIDKGMSVEQIVAAQPAKGFAPRYGTEPGRTDAFVGAIDRSLRAHR